MSRYSYRNNLRWARKRARRKQRNIEGYENDQRRWLAAWAKVWGRDLGWPVKYPPQHGARGIRP